MFYFIILAILEIGGFYFTYKIFDYLKCQYIIKNNKINKNTNILISGAARGLGKFIATQFALKKQCKIIIIDIDLDRAKQTAKELEVLGSLTSIFQCDLSQQQEIENVMEEILLKYDNIDILINYTGMVDLKLFHESDPEMDKKIMAVNYIAPITITRKILPLMIENRKGHIVNVSSIYGISPALNMSSYCASKAALTGFHHALRLELQYSKCDFIQTTLVMSEITKSCVQFQGFTKKINIFKLLDIDYVAKDIYQGILAKRKEIYCKDYLKSFLLFERLLPIGIMDRIKCYTYSQNVTRWDIFKNKDIQEKQQIQNNQKLKKE